MSGDLKSGLTEVGGPPSVSIEFSGLPVDDISESSGPLASLLLFFTLFLLLSFLGCSVELPGLGRSTLGTFLVHQFGSAAQTQSGFGAVSSSDTWTLTFENQPSYR